MLDFESQYPLYPVNRLLVSRLRNRLRNHPFLLIHKNRVNSLCLLCGLESSDWQLLINWFYPELCLFLYFDLQTLSMLGRFYHLNITYNIFIFLAIIFLYLFFKPEENISVSFLKEIIYFLYSIGNGIGHPF